jgi:oligopeptide transport system substrate-binding protein
VFSFWQPTTQLRSGGWALGWLVGLCFWLTACKPSGRPGLVIHNGAEPETIDPQTVAALSDGRVASALFEGLLRQDPQTGNAIPGLAESWTTSPDGLTYTFRLQPNAQWSDGTPITSEDFVWSWRRAVTPGTGARYAGQFAYVRNGRAIYTGLERDASKLGVQALNAHELRVQLVSPTPFFPELLTSWVFFPVPHRAIEHWGNRWTTAPSLPCSGPYRLLEWRINERLRLQRNERYWDAAHVKTERIDLIHGENGPTALNLFLTGKVDIVLDNSLFPTELNDLLVRRADFQAYDYLGTYFLRFNCQKAPYDDPRVRRAIGMAIDRQRIVERVTGLGEKTSAALVPPGTAQYAPADDAGYNIVQARRLLAAAGYSGSRPFPALVYTYSTNTKLHEQIGVEIQSMLKESLDITVELRPLETRNYFSEMSLRHFDLIRSSWVADYNDPSTFLDIFTSGSGNNRTGWKNTQYDSLLDQASRSPNLATRNLLLHEAETILVRDEAPIVCLYHYRGLYAADPAKVGGIYPNPMDRHPLWAMFRKDGEVRR